ncbi:neutral zinc metallopeptidase [Kribbella sp. NPDC004536]|uniref:neutral zinc metallopeptidase n=1 Tax=Kribbella sp. NPDC004536 TaxID=3364106 RepID=UPI0036C99117
MPRWAMVTALLVLTATACATTAPAAVPTPTPAASATRTPTPPPAPRRTKVVPPVAAPSPTPEPLLVANGLYAAGTMRAVRCTLPDVVPTNGAGVLRYARTLVGCLNSAWAPLFPRADAVFMPARLVALGTGDCDRQDDVFHRGAYYATGKSTICLDGRTFAAESDRDWRTVQLQHTVAHEYGHHLQTLTGIMTTYDLGQLQTASSDLERNRRMELQASCLAAVFMGIHKNALGLSGSRLD